MKTRIAKKILNLNGRHWYRFYREHSGYDLAPLNANRYYKANKVLHRTPYYDLPWLNLIYKLYGKPNGIGLIVERNEISPIPITPEILEKNGFVIKKKWAQIGNFGDSPLIMWHFEDDKFLYDYKHELEIHQNDTGKVHVTVPCEYIHQLQQAMCLCGIKKDIIVEDKK